MADKVCIVTGVGPGTGAATTRRFAAGGYAVAMLARNRERLAALEREIPNTSAHPCDVTDEAQLHDDVYTAHWLDGKDIGQDDVLAEIAERCGLSRTEFLSALSDPHYEAAPARRNAEAETDGVFGFPLFLYAEQKFWGNGRVEWLVRALQQKG